MSATTLQCPTTQIQTVYADKIKQLTQELDKQNNYWKNASKLIKPTDKNKAISIAIKVMRKHSELDYKNTDSLKSKIRQFYQTYKGIHNMPLPYTDIFTGKKIKEDDKNKLCNCLRSTKDFYSSKCYQQTFKLSKNSITLNEWDPEIDKGITITEKDGTVISGLSRCDIDKKYNNNYCNKSTAFKTNCTGQGHTKGPINQKLINASVKYLQLILLEKKIKALNSLNNVTDYNFISKIPPPLPSCDSIGLNCNDQQFESIECCDKGIRSRYQCNVNPVISESTSVLLDGTQVPTDCLSSKENIHGTKEVAKSKYTKDVIKSTPLELTKDTSENLYLFDSYLCPVIHDDKQTYCNKVYSLDGLQYGDLSRGLYDNVRSMASYIGLLTNPDISVGSNYLATTHQCIDDNGNKQNVQTPISSGGGGNRATNLIKLAHSINEAISSYTNQPTTKDYISGDDLQQSDILQELHETKVGVMETILTYKFIMTDEIKYYINALFKGNEGGIVYSLIDDIKETEPVALLNRFLEQNTDDTMKCSDIAKQSTDYSLSEYIVKNTGKVNRNGTAELTTGNTFPVSLDHCYIENEGLEGFEDFKINKINKVHICMACFVFIIMIFLLLKYYL
jgi:hypothetical protein